MSWICICSTVIAAIDCSQNISLSYIIWMIGSYLHNQGWNHAWSMGMVCLNIIECTCIAITPSPHIHTHTLQLKGSALKTFSTVWLLYCSVIFSMAFGFWMDFELIQNSGLSTSSKIPYKDLLDICLSFEIQTKVIVPQNYLQKVLMYSPPHYVLEYNTIHF